MHLVIYTIFAAVTREAVSNILGITDYLKNSEETGASASTNGISWVGFTPCKREGRRFVGQFVSTQNDIMRDPKRTSEPFQARVASFSLTDGDLHDTNIC